MILLKFKARFFGELFKETFHFVVCDFQFLSTLLADEMVMRGIADLVGGFAALAMSFLCQAAFNQKSQGAVDGGFFDVG